MKHLKSSCLWIMFLLPCLVMAQDDSAYMSVTDNIVASIKANTNLSKQTIIADWTRTTTNDRFVWIDTASMQAVKITMDSTISTTVKNERVLREKNMVFFYLAGRLIFAEVTLNNWLSKGSCSYIYYFRNGVPVKDEITSGIATKSTLAYKPERIMKAGDEGMKVYTEHLDYFTKQVRTKE